MGGPEKSGYCGGKFWPNEKDLIKGIVAAKSLHTFVAILRLPDGFTLKVFHIKHQEKTKRTAKNKKLALLILIFSYRCFRTDIFVPIKVYQTIKAIEPGEVLR